MNKVNYQKELEKLIKCISDTPDKQYKLLLHACCAPCSSYCLEYLSEYFEITVLFYNPNIDTDEEYEKRAEELKRFIKEKEFKKHVDIIDMDHDPQVFYDAVKGYEHYEEGADRCFLCYRLRMEMAAKLAAKEQYDYFCTTLSISPLKNAEAINSIGYELADIYGVSWLPSDFKKNNGYLRSIELSKEYDLYRQNYCGCIFSKKKESPFSDCID